VGRVPIGTTETTGTRAARGDVTAVRLLVEVDVDFFRVPRDHVGGPKNKPAHSMRDEVCVGELRVDMLGTTCECRLLLAVTLPFEVGTLVNAELVGLAVGHWSRRALSSKDSQTPLPGFRTAMKNSKTRTMNWSTKSTNGLTSHKTELPSLTCRWSFTLAVRITVTTERMVSAHAAAANRLADCLSKVNTLHVSIQRACNGEELDQNAHYRAGAEPWLSSESQLQNRERTWS